MRFLISHISRGRARGRGLVEPGKTSAATWTRAVVPMADAWGLVALPANSIATANAHRFQRDVVGDEGCVWLTVSLRAAGVAIFCGWVQYTLVCITSALRLDVV